MAAALSTQSSAMAERVRRAAQLLLEARQSGRRLTALPDDVRPRTTEEAYAIQDSVLEQLGLVGGWKVGAKSATAEPTCAPLLATLVLRSPQQFPAGTFALNGVEAELAFTLARDLPLRDELYTEAEMPHVLASVHVAIEVVDSRFFDIGATGSLSLLADFQSNGALVLGTGVALPVSFTPSEQMVRLDIDGAQIVEAQGSNPAGGLFRLLAWLANHVAARCGGLRRGEVVTTGSWTGMRFVASGAYVAANFSGIGQVDIRF